MSRPTGWLVGSTSPWGPRVGFMGGPSPWAGLVGGPSPWAWLVGGPSPWVGLVGGGRSPWFYCELWHCEWLLRWRDAIGIIDDLIGRNSHVEVVDVLPGQSCHTSQEVTLRVDVLQSLLSCSVCNDLLCNSPQVVLGKS